MRVQKVTFSAKVLRHVLFPKLRFYYSKTIVLRGREDPEITRNGAKTLRKVRPIFGDVFFPILVAFRAHFLTKKET